MEWAQRYLRLVKYLLSDKKNHKLSAASPEPLSVFGRPALCVNINSERENLHFF